MLTGDSFRAASHASPPLITPQTPAVLWTASSMGGQEGFPVFGEELNRPQGFYPEVKRRMTAPRVQSARLDCHSADLQQFGCKSVYPLHSRSWPCRQKTRVPGSLWRPRYPKSLYCCCCLEAQPQYELEVPAAYEIALAGGLPIGGPWEEPGCASGVAAKDGPIVIVSHPARRTAGP